MAEVAAGNVAVIKQLQNMADVVWIVAVSKAVSFECSC